MPTSNVHQLPAAPEPDLRSVAEVARLFSVSDDTVRRWIQEGHLRAINIGRAGGRQTRWRIDIEDARRLIARTTKQGDRS